MSVNGCLFLCQPCDELATFPRVYPRPVLAGIGPAPCVPVQLQIMNEWLWLEGVAVCCHAFYTPALCLIMLTLNAHSLCDAMFCKKVLHFDVEISWTRVLSFVSELELS